MSNRIRKTRPQTVCVRKHGRASVSASVTIEAALAVPIFFFALVCLIYLLELMAIGTAVRSGLQYAGKQATDHCILSGADPDSHILIAVDRV